MVPKKKGMNLIMPSGRRSLPVFYQDELSKIFG
jgi:hypothetical protein